MKNIIKSIKKRVTDYKLVRKSELREVYEALNDLHKVSFCDCGAALTLYEYAKRHSDDEEVIAERKQQCIESLHKLLESAGDEKCFHAIVTLDIVSESR